mmetsp:Transcript_41117/g.117563  ORF Transcript_41117/g.117563 Transcript_41117/m.117563 type:complete len:132 (-) Transcript_41117:77-472(-)
MARVSAIVLLAVGTLVGRSSAVVVELRGAAQRSTFTINDKVYVDGSLFSESAALNDNIGCHEHKGTSSFKVCGCGVKVIAHLMTECQTYKKYDTQVGKCDCSSTACDEVSLSSGYSAPFNWQAASFEVSPC